MFFIFALLVISILFFTLVYADTPVDSCQTLSEINETYILNQSILNRASDCFLIIGNNIVFDLNGNIIDGVGSRVAIKVQSSGVTVTNGIIKEFGFGIFFDLFPKTDNGIINYMTLTDNKVAILIEGSNNTKIISNTIVNNIRSPGAGIEMITRVYNTLIKSNVIKNNTQGIGSNDAHFSNVSFNNITATIFGITLGVGSSNWTITFNNVSGDGLAIRVGVGTNPTKISFNNTISHNTISSSGIFLDEKSANNTGSHNCGGSIIDNGVDNNVTNVGCPTDLEILEIIPIQVVRGIDIVKGKSGIVRVVVRNNGPLNASGTVNVTLDGSLLNTFQGESDTKLILANQNETFDFSFNPASIGTKTFVAEVEIG